MNRAWPWAKSSAWYTGRSENPPGLVAATAGAPAVPRAAAPAIAAIHQERPSLRMGGSQTFGAAKIERTRRLSYPRVGAGHPRRSRRPGARRRAGVAARRTWWGQPPPAYRPSTLARPRPQAFYLENRLR